MAMQSYCIVHPGSEDGGSKFQYDSSSVKIEVPGSDSSGDPYEDSGMSAGAGEEDTILFDQVFPPKTSQEKRRMRRASVERGALARSFGCPRIHISRDSCRPLLPAKPALNTDQVGFDQEKIFQDIARSHVRSALQSFQSAIFIASGSTGSGKTFAVTGGAQRFSARRPRVRMAFSEAFRRREQPGAQGRSPWVLELRPSRSSVVHRGRAVPMARMAGPTWTFAGAGDEAEGLTSSSSVHSARSTSLAQTTSLAEQGEVRWLVWQICHRIPRLTVEPSQKELEEWWSKCRHFEPTTVASAVQATREAVQRLQPLLLFLRVEVPEFCGVTTRLLFFPPKPCSQRPPASLAVDEPIQGVSSADSCSAVSTFDDISELESDSQPEKEQPLPPIPPSRIRCGAALSGQPEREEIEISVSFYELYKDAVIDLLSERRRKVPIKATGNGPQLVGLLRQAVSTESDAYHLLFQGDSNRHFQSFAQNAETSRGHVFYVLHLCHRISGQKAVLAFVDLAAPIAVRNPANTAIAQGLDALKATLLAMRDGREAFWESAILPQLLEPWLSSQSDSSVVLLSPLRYSPDMHQEVHEWLTFTRLVQENDKLFGRPLQSNWSKKGGPNPLQVPASFQGGEEVKEESKKEEACKQLSPAKAETPKANEKSEKGVEATSGDPEGPRLEAKAIQTPPASGRKQVKALSPMHSKVPAPGIGAPSSEKLEALRVQQLRFGAVTPPVPAASPLPGTRSLLRVAAHARSSGNGVVTGVPLEIFAEGLRARTDARRLVKAPEGRRAGGGIAIDRDPAAQVRGQAVRAHDVGSPPRPAIPFAQALSPARSVSPMRLRAWHDGSCMHLQWSCWSRS
eukprot:g9521.t1